MRIFHKRHNCRCLYCKKEFVGFRHQRYCSKQCSWNFRYAEGSSNSKICKVCDLPFLPKRSNQLICSSVCKNKLKHQQRVDAPKQPCEFCGFEDLRAIHLHHINRDSGAGVMCLCANHHYIYHSIMGWNGVSEHKTSQEVINIIKNGREVLNSPNLGVGAPNFND